MKRKIFTIVAVAGFLLRAQAQTTQVVNISTGIINGSTTHFSYGSTDDTWLVQEPGGSSFIQPIVVHPHSGWAGSYHAEWITPEVDWFGDIASLPVNDYTYKTTFTTSNCPLSAILHLKEYAADNKLTSINVNGHTHTFSALFNSLSGPTNIDITSELVIGMNTITAVVNNVTPGDLSGVSPSVTGLILYGDVTITYPFVTFTGPTSFCSGDALTFTATANTTTNYSWTLSECTSSGVYIPGGYSWSQNYSGTPGTYTFPVTLPCAKYYKVTLSVLLSCGNSMKVTSIIYINCLPTAKAGPDVTICSGDCIGIGPVAQEGNSYQWTRRIGHLAIVAGNTSQIIVCPTATTTYTLTVTNAAGCTASDAITVNVQTNDPSFSISNNTSNASYYTVTATPNVLSPPAGTNYAWMLEDLDASNNDIFLINNPVIWQTFPSVTSNVFQGFNGSTAYPAPPSSTTTLPSSPAVGQFLYTHTYRITRATWTEVCPWKQSSQTITVVKSLANGNPTLLVTDDNTAPDFSGYIQAQASGISNQLTDDLLSVYPNPGNGMFTLTTNQLSNGVIDVYDMLGNKVQTIVLKNNTTDYKLDLSGYSKGIYMLNVASGEKRYSKKIILE